jgi:hypothetical protein
MFTWTGCADERACVKGGAQVMQIFEIIPMHGVIVPFITSIGKGANCLDLRDRGAGIGALCPGRRAAVQVARHHSLLFLLLYSSVDRREVRPVSEMASTAHEARARTRALTGLRCPKVG